MKSMNCNIACLDACCYINYVAPSVPPNHVDVTRPRSNATVMIVSWIPLNLTEARGFISHYTVNYTLSTQKRRPEDAMTETVPGMDTNTTRIEGLDANTDYIVQVSATNGAGISPLSAPLEAAAPVVEG